MRLRLAALIIGLLLAGCAMADSGIEKVYPDIPVNAYTPLQVWKVTLETDSSGDASYITGLLTGKLYSVDVIANDLDKSTNLTIAEYLPGKNTTILSKDVYQGNGTYFPRNGGYEYMIKGLVRLAITGGDPNKEVLVYLNIER